MAANMYRVGGKVERGNIDEPSRNVFMSGWPRSAAGLLWYLQSVVRLSFPSFISLKLKSLVLHR